MEQELLELAQPTIMKGLPFTSVMDLLYFIGMLVIAGMLIIWVVGKIAMAIKGDD